MDTDQIIFMPNAGFAAVLLPVDGTIILRWEEDLRLPISRAKRDERDFDIGDDETIDVLWYRIGQSLPTGFEVLDFEVKGQAAYAYIGAVPVLTNGSQDREELIDFFRPAVDVLRKVTDPDIARPEEYVFRPVD